MQIAILLYPGLTALDALGPFELLRGIPGAEIRLVWKEVGPVLTDSNVLVVGATHRLDETRRPDIVLVPGSSNRTTTLMADAEVKAWLRHAHDHTRLTTSVCSGALILGAAGLLEGRAATSHWAALPWLSQFGAQARPHDRIVRDGKVWTAAGVSAGIDLALAVVAEVADEETARVAQLTIEYDPRPPFDSGHMDKAHPRTIERAKREMLAASLNASELIALPSVLSRAWARALYRKVRGEPVPAPVP